MHIYPSISLSLYTSLSLYIYIYIHTYIHTYQRGSRLAAAGRPPGGALLIYYNILKYTIIHYNIL